MLPGLATRPWACGGSGIHGSITMIMFARDGRDRDRQGRCDSRTHAPDRPTGINTTTPQGLAGRIRRGPRASGGGGVELGDDWSNGHAGPVAAARQDGRETRSEWAWARRKVQLLLGRRWPGRAVRFLLAGQLSSCVVIANCMLCRTTACRDARRASGERARKRICTPCHWCAQSRR